MVCNMILAKREKYVLRNWAEGDSSPKGFPGSYTLDFDGQQVGAIAGSIFAIQRIDINPKRRGHGTHFIKLMIEVARERKSQGHNVGQKWFMVLGVEGDTPEDKKALEHILKDKFGFVCTDEGTWLLPL